MLFECRLVNAEVYLFGASRRYTQAVAAELRFLSSTSCLSCFQSLRRMSCPLLASVLSGRSQVNQWS